MAIPVTKLYLSSILAGAGYRYTPETPGDFAPSATGATGSTWLASIADLNGDLMPEIITGSPGSDDKAVDAGRVYVTFGTATPGGSGSLGDTTSEIIIDGGRAGDHAGAAVGSITDLNGDGRAEILVGAPLVENGTKVDAGAAYVLWGKAVAGGIDLLDPASGAGNGIGYIIKGEAAGDHAGGALASIADLNGDASHLAEVVVGAAGNDAGGLDAGAAYVVWGKAADGAVNLTTVAAGTGGFRITGQAAGDAAGTALATLADLNGDGRGEILVGAPGNDAGGLDAGAAYVVFGKATGTAVSLTTIAAGTGGYRITGQAGDHVGAAVSTIGDVNADGLADILLGAPNGGHAYVVFGKSSTTAVLLSDVATGHGGYMITPEATGDLTGMSVTGGADFNHDGVADLVIGTPGNAEGGTNAGAVYVVWGGGNSNVDLSLVAQGIGGAKIVGAAGSLTGAAVALAGDVNHDGNPDLLIGSPGSAGEASNIVFDPASWQPDPNIYGTNGADSMAAGFGGLHLIGDTADSIYGLGGNDSISAAGGNDLVDAGSGNDTVDGGSGDNTLLGGAGTDSLLGGSGNDSLDGGAGADTMAGGAGNDTYVVDAAGDVVTEAAGAGTDTVQAGITYTLGANLEALVLTGTAHVGTGNGLDNTLSASSGANTLMGLAGNDTLLGSTGNDSLDGGSGADSMAGGAGNDSYVVDNTGDVVSEAVGGGTDTVQASIDFTLGANLEGLVLTGTAHSATGNELANTLVANTTDSTLQGLAGNDTLTGNIGNDSLDGGSGADSMAGGAGNDTYVVDNAGDVVSEALAGGADTVQASIDHTLAANVEALLLTGTATHGTGNALDNLLTGNDLGNTLSGAAGNDTLLGGTGNDSLDGGSGADSMAGGTGNDTYVVDNAGDVVSEAAAGGTDTVQASIDITLADNVEALVLTAAGHLGTGNAGDNLLMAAAGGDSLAGAAGADTLLGNTGADNLDGGTGADSMAGGAGNDTYVVDNVGDVVTEAAGAGTDTVLASVDVTLADNVEALVMTASGHVGTGNASDNSLLGSIGADTLLGGAGNDTIDGNGGGDSLVGGDGNDTYIIRSSSDVVVETATGGFDTVIVTTDWTLADNIEAVQLTGGAHALTGNAGNNQLSGSSSSDTLDGGGGNDTLLGGDGNDVLVASSGAATMDGGSGDDRYVLRGGAARIEDFLGNDTLDASQATGDTRLDLSEQTASEVEGKTIDFGTGGTTAAPLDVQFLQDLTGSFADDIITVRGLVPQIVTALQAVQSNAVFGVSTFRDKPIGGFGAPGDWVYQQQLALSVDTTALTNAYTAMVANNGNDGPEAQIEALMQLALHSTDVGFRANSARFVVLFTDAPFHMAGDGAAAGITTPNNGDGVLDGTPPGTGEDYPFIAQVKLALEAANIIPIFAIAGGYDATYQDLVTQLGRGAEVTLTANSSNIITALNTGLTTATTTTIENAWGGEGNDTLIGGAIANSLVGNGGNDSLDGGAGADSMAGGMGHDTYVVDNVGDVVTELAAQGSDTVLASIDYTLTANVEALVLTGNAHVGTGSALDNSLTGGAGADTLLGMDGNDTLDGGGGADSLVGGAGNDLYIVTNATTVVAEDLAGGTDTVQASIDITLGANLEVLVLTGAATHGTGNQLDNALTAGSGDATLNGLDGNDTLLGAAGNDSLDGGSGADSMAGGAGNDSYVVDNAGDVVGEVAGGGADTVYASIDHTLEANLEALVLTGTATSGIGNALDNMLTAGSGDAALSGLDGNDTLLGAAGNDSLDGGTGADSMAGGAGNDSYVVDNAGDVVTEAAGGGTDTVLASIDYTLGDNLEALVLTGAGHVGIGNALDNMLSAGSGDATLLGLDGNDTLLGGTGNDSLDGGIGADSMAGGAGNDSYVVNNASDVVAELAGQGTDTVQASIDTTLGANLEALVLTGAATLGTGNLLDNMLTAGSGDATLNGLDGNDTMLGAAGNDSLDGGTGADSMAGGAGNDSYVVNNASDVVAELAGQGNDTVQASIDWTLGANLEALVLTAAGHVGAGNALDNLLLGSSGVDTLLGGAGNDTLDGAGGLDSLAGGTGNDLYLVGTPGEKLMELSGGGIDTVQASIAWTLAINFENLVLTGTAVNGIGNAAANVITGNDLGNSLKGMVGNDTLLGGAGNDTLDGGTGADSMAGGAGNDLYMVDSIGDLVVEQPGGGIDKVQASVSYALGGEVENLTLTGAATINGFGNALGNVITGNSANNLLDGGAGNDTLSGGSGNDTLLGGGGADQLTGGLGADTFRFGTPADGGDKVIDFVSGTDVLEFSALGFGGGLVAGMDLGAAEGLVLGARATQAHGQFLYNDASGTLFWDADGNGVGAKILIASLVGHPALAASDLHIIG